MLSDQQSQMKPYAIQYEALAGQRSGLAGIKREALNDEHQIENWVKDPSVLGFDILLIGRQVPTGNGDASICSLLITEL